MCKADVSLTYKSALPEPQRFKFLRLSPEMTMDQGIMFCFRVFNDKQYAHFQKLIKGRHTDRQTDRQTHRQTDRQRDRDRHTQTEREKNRVREREIDDKRARIRAILQ